MERIVQTIIPVFLVILLGWVLARRGVLPQSVAGPLNRLVYTIAIPAMIFLKVSRAPLGEHARPELVGATLAPVLLAAGLALAAVKIFRIRPDLRGTFSQSAFHGNLGYIGLAVAFYHLGDDGLTRASILAAFLMLLQNFLSVAFLQGFAAERTPGPRLWFFLKKIGANPVILGVISGVAFTLAGLELPVTAERSLSILASMALPLALLVIGAGLNFGLIREELPYVLGAGLVKMGIVPAAGLLFYAWAGVPHEAAVPGLILLAAPTATVTYVMSREMGGSTDLAMAAVSVNTLLSALTYAFWLTVAG